MKKTFIVLAIILGTFIAAASVPSPLYDIFQQQWHFSTIVLTLIFATYALSLLLALLCTGALSDYIGRRPVLVCALIIELLSMVMFALARGPTWLFVARFLQGFATGMATSTVSAGLIDSQPKHKPGLAPLISTIVPVVSLGVGAMIASFLSAYAPWPTHLVFWLMGIIVCFLGASVMCLMSETIARKPGWQHSLMPTFTLPPLAKRQFIMAGPSLVADWALIGLYLSLIPSAVLVIQHAASQLSGGFVIVLFTAPGALMSFVLRNKSDKSLLRFGAVLAIIGLLGTALSIVHTNIALFYSGTTLAGLGFGPSFTGVFRSIMREARPDRRAGLASIVYVVSYLSFSIPVVIAGIIAAKENIRVAILFYSVASILLYLATLVSHISKDTKSNS